MKGLTKKSCCDKRLCEKMKNSSVKIHDIYKNINQENDKLYNEIKVYHVSYNILSVFYLYLYQILAMNHYLSIFLVY